MNFFGKKKAIAGALLLIILLQCFPGTVMGYDVYAFARSFVGAQVEQSNWIIDANKAKIKLMFKLGTGLYEKIWRSGFSVLENKTGLNEQNEQYNTLKNNRLFKTGFKSGMVKGIGDMTGEMYSLLARIPTCPERIVDFGYNYIEDPKKYQRMVINGAKATIGMVLNPQILYRYCKNTYLEAAKDPVKFGNLHGEALAIGGTLLFGMGQIRTAGTATKTVNIAKPASMLESTAKSGSLQASIVRTGAIKVSTLIDKVNIKFEGFLRQFPRFDTVIARPNSLMATDLTVNQPVQSFKGNLGKMVVPLNIQVKSLSIENKVIYFTPKDYFESSLGASLKNTYKVGDAISDDTVVKKLGNKLFLQKNGILYESQLDDGYRKVHSFVNFKDVNGLWEEGTGTLANGLYQFVLTADEKLIISKPHFTHSRLTGGHPVKYAGELCFDSGKLLYWNNKSGHYIPDLDNAIYALRAIKSTFNGKVKFERYIW